MQNGRTSSCPEPCRTKLFGCQQCCPKTLSKVCFERYWQVEQFLEHHQVVSGTDALDDLIAGNPETLHRTPDRRRIFKPRTQRMRFAVPVDADNRNHLVVVRD